MRPDARALLGLRPAGSVTGRLAAAARPCPATRDAAAAASASPGRRRRRLSASACGSCGFRIGGLRERIEDRHGVGARRQWSSCDLWSSSPCCRCSWNRAAGRAGGGVAALGARRGAARLLARRHDENPIEPRRVRARLTAAARRDSRRPNAAGSSSASLPEHRSARASSDRRHRSPLTILVCPTLAHSARIWLTSRSSR